MILIIRNQLNLSESRLADSELPEPVCLLGVQKWTILWAYEILAKEDSLNLKLASHFNCLTTFTSGPQIFFSTAQTRFALVYALSDSSVNTQTQGEQTQGGCSGILTPGLAGPTRAQLTLASVSGSAGSGDAPQANPQHGPVTEVRATRGYLPGMSQENFFCRPRDVLGNSPKIRRAGAD